MVIDDLNLKSISVSPYKTDTTLIVDSDAVLTFPIATQFLQPVSWYGP